MKCKDCKYYAPGGLWAEVETIDLSLYEIDGRGTESGFWNPRDKAEFINTEKINNMDSVRVTDWESYKLLNKSAVIMMDTSVGYGVCLHSKIIDMEKEAYIGNKEVMPTDGLIAKSQHSDSLSYIEVGEDFGCIHFDQK